ncbi:MAG: serine/threonine-protein phosphatase [Agathobacter sp.]|nr:serine/threonine-protein phosphatase [Agathobacter sp.]
MECFICKYTDKGGRENNEDFVAITEDTFVLADGLGGHSNGETASKLAVEYIINRADEMISIDNKGLHELISDVNQVVVANRMGDMATTIVAAFVRNGYFNYFNVGDSRLYYFRDKHVLIQSRDHSVTQACVDLGEIKPDEIRFHQDRNKLTKALGLKSEISVSQRFDPIEIKCGDSFLLCSDGFWEYIYEDEMIKCLCKSNTPQEWFTQMLDIVKKRVKKCYDNISAICVFIR